MHKYPPGISRAFGKQEAASSVNGFEGRAFWGEVWKTTVKFVVGRV